MTKLNLTKTTTNNVILKGGLFIVPNQFSRVKDFIESSAERITRSWDVSEDDIMIQVWGYTDKIDNLMCDFYDEDTENIPELKAFGCNTMSGYRCLIPESMPAEPFKDLDDGDKIYLEFNDEENNITGAIEFTLNQKCKKI